MAIQLTVKNLQKKIPINLNLIKQKIVSILCSENVLDADLSVVFLTDQRIRTLNKKYLNHDYATDVLSFDLLSHQKISKNKYLEGEIFVSAETAYRNAKIYGSTASQELMLYVVHGILHLLGYNDKTVLDIKKMRAKEQQIFNFLKK
ncbi:MAG: rRNA maturation RNase YbeY [Candidatus Omnitrophica bacterium]|nr:rRNA maturation RNase YbeY [Candidatus Omnitrophota bacterium]